MTSNPQSAIDAFHRKLDMFFHLHVERAFDPERLHWWISLSGGKDSYAMAEGIRRWYQARGLRLTATGFTIDQWGGAAPLSIGAQLPWLSVEVLDARELTKSVTGYAPGEQAPCRRCADTRRQVTDSLLLRRPVAQGFVPFLARGLHLSDTAVSLAWRFALGRDAASDLLGAGKARPIAQMAGDVHLVKPLAYAREFETA